MSRENAPATWARSAVNRRRFLASSAAAGAGAASLALVGCGDDDDDAPEPTLTATTGGPALPQPTASAAPAEAVTSGGVGYYNASMGIVPSLDPHRAPNNGVQDLLSSTMSRLLAFTDRHGEFIAGDLAEGLPEQPDDVTLLFRLREGVRWHDKPPVSGRELTVEDVVYSIERQKAGLDREGAADPTFLNQQAMSLVDSVEAIDRRSVTLRLARPDVTFLNTLAGPGAFIVAPEAVDSFSNEDWLAVDPRVLIGTGPFVLEDLEEDGIGRLTRHPEFYDPGRPYLDGLRTLGTSETDFTGEASFRSKNLDWWDAPHVGPATDSVIADHPEVVVQEYGSPDTMVTTFATTAPPWNDARLLQAVNRAVDRRQLVERLHGGRGKPSALVPWPWTFWALPEDALATLPGYLTDRDEDAREARQLWEAAEGPNTLLITLPDIWTPLFPDTTAVLAEQLGTALGIDVQTQVLDYGQITGQMVARTLSFWFGWGSPSAPDPTAGLHAAFHSRSPGNFWGTNQPGGLVVDGLDAQLEQMIVTVDRDERRDIIRDIQRKATEVGCLGYMTFYNYSTRLLNWPYCRGLTASSFYRGQNLKDHWLDQSDPSFPGRP